MTNHYTDVCEATIKSLRQQLADRDEQISDLTVSSDTYFAERNSARDVWRRASKDRDELRQQLAAALVEVKLLRDNLLYYAEGGQNDQHARDALAIQPDDSALKEWLGEPRSYLYKFNSEFGDGTFWSHRPTHNGQNALESIPLYAPKGMK